MGSEMCIRDRQQCDKRPAAGREKFCTKGIARTKAIYFFEMSVLFETGELNAYVYDSGGLYRRKYVTW